MANFVDFDPISYTGQSANEILSQDIMTSDVHNLGIQIMGDVKTKRQLVMGEVSDLFKEYTCAFEPNGNVILSEDFIEPTMIRSDLEECYDAFISSFLAEQTEVSLNGGIPSTFSNWFFPKYRDKLKAEYGEMFWNGDKAYTGATKTYLKLVDGVVTKLNAASNTVKVSGAALTVANILGEVEKVANAIIGMDDINIDNHKIFMNQNDYRKLVSALGANANSPLTNQVWSNFTKEGDKVYAYGFEIVPCAIAKGKMVAANPKNLVLGYDLENGETSYKMIDMRETTLDNSFRLSVITNIAVGVIYPQTIVLYA